MPARRTSAAEKAAKGTHLSARSVRSSGVATQVAGARLSPEPPKGFPSDAKEAWEAAVINAPQGSLLATDVSVLERWCRSYALYRRIVKEVEHSDVTVDDGKGGVKMNPLFAAMQSLDAGLLRLEKELGFTPCARARVSAPEAEEEEKNPFIDC